MTPRWSDRPTVPGVLLFVASETIFFTLLIIGYIHYHRHPEVAEAARAHLDPLRMGLFSLFLFASSFTAWRAERSRRAGRAAARRGWLGATLALGVVFLVGQGLEYAGLITADVGLATGLFGGSFFTLTGFHGLHVLVGLIMLGGVLGLDLAGALGAHDGAAQQSVSIYWHFVDGIWVVIFGVVYVLARGGAPV